MPTQRPQIAQDLFATLRLREEQAAGFGARHLAAVPGTDSMLYWLSEAAREARLAASRKQVHVAASADTDQSTIARFEKHIAWPRDPDQTIRAYAEDLDIDQLELWAQAVKMWREDRESAAEMDQAIQGLEDEASPDAQRRGES